MNKYLNRLQFFDKFGYDRAFEEFKVKDDNNDDENSFLLSLLESGSDYELTTVRNAINFARSWAELGHTLSHHVLARILYLCFLEPKLVNQMSFITDIVRDRSWIFRALAKMVSSKYDLFTKSIKENCQIWDFLYDSLLSDAMSKQSECRVAYSERSKSFLIEAIPLYWPFEKSSKVKFNDLVNSVLTFCVEAQSQAAYLIVNVFCFAFPENVAKVINDNLYQLSSDALFQLLKLNLIEIPSCDPDRGAILAAKMLPFNPKLALELAESDQKSKDKQDIIEMIKHFNPGSQTFVFES